MDVDRFKQIVDQTVKETAELLVKKNAEYAGSEDVLANFKRNGKRNGQSQLECWMVYFNKHIDSIHTYMARVKRKCIERSLLNVLENYRDNHTVCSPEGFLRLVEIELPHGVGAIDSELSENIEGRLNDVINYCILCKALLADIREGGK